MFSIKHLGEVFKREKHIIVQDDNDQTINGEKSKIHIKAMRMHSNYRRGTERGYKHEDYLKVFINTWKVDYSPL